MGADIREQLKDAALEPSFDIDVDDLHQRARRTHIRNVAAAAAISVVALVAGAALVGSLDPVPVVLSPGDEDEQRDVEEERTTAIERAKERTEHWSELTRGTLSDGATWLLHGQTMDDAVCLRWHIPGTDREQINCSADIDWDDMDRHAGDMLVLGNLGPELVLGSVGPAITTVEIGLTHGSKIEASLYEIQQSGFHAYVAETHGQTVDDVTGRDADGRVRSRLDFPADH